MNSIDTRLLTKSILAATIAVGGFTTAAHAQFLTATPDQSGTQNDGLVCRSGYTPNFNGASLKCSKTSKITVQLVCADPGFDKYVARVSAGGTQEGQDVCAKSGGKVSFDSDDSIGGGTNFTKGVDWEFAKADKVKIEEKTTARDLEEAAAFGGTAADVETVAGETVFNRQANGIIDNASVTLTHFTFAIPTGGGLGNQGPVGLPVTSSSKSAFVPKPLPR